MGKKIWMERILSIENEYKSREQLEKQIRQLRTDFDAQTITLMNSLNDNKDLKDHNQRLVNVNIQLNKDIKEIAASLLVFKPQLSVSYVQILQGIVKR